MDASLWNWHNLTHGTNGLIIGYGVALISVLAGMLKGRAPAANFLWLPVIAAGAILLGAILLSVLARFWPTPPQGAPLSPGRDLVAVAITVVVGFIAGLIAAQKVPDRTHKRGSLVIDGAGQTHTRRADPEQLAFAGIPLKPEDETKHFKLIGTTGTGKSTAIRQLLEGVLDRGDRAVIADPDGGYLKRYYDPERGDVILNPFDERSLKWDLFGEIVNSYDVEQLARSLIPDGETASSTEWRTYARTFFSAVTKQTRLIGNKDTAELYRLLTSASTDELKILLEGTPAQPFLAEGNARMFGSIRSVTAAAVASLAYIDEQITKTFSVRDWVRSGRGVLFIPYRADQIAALRDVIATWMRIAIFQCMSESERDNYLWFVIDELDALGTIDGLKDALARLRKFGGRCVLGFQSIAQVSSLYGQGDAQTIVENCGNTLILRCSASEGGGTSRFASKLIGEREIIRETTSKSHSTLDLFSKQGPHSSVSKSEQHVIESAVLASEIEQLPDLSGYLKVASQPAWMKIRLKKA
jgi:type IV secretory pathway TraG/TraD family ATPase VirD4